MKGSSTLLASAVMLALVHCGSSNDDASTFPPLTVASLGCRLLETDAGADAPLSGACVAAATACVQVKAQPCSASHPESTSASAQECSCVDLVWSCKIVAGGATQFGCATDADGGF